MDERRARRATLAERRERHAAVGDPQAVLDAALRFLEARSRSVAEVRRRLVSTGYRTELVEGAIARLLDLGMLDDEAFARAWVESRDRAHPRGTGALRRELSLKGIDRVTVDTVLGERGDAGEEADLAAAERLLERDGAALARIAEPRQRTRRAYVLLARHGFDPSTASELARRVGATPDADEVDDAP